jgi:hypothetical protein
LLPSVVSPRTRTVAGEPGVPFWVTVRPATRPCSARIGLFVGVERIAAVSATTTEPVSLCVETVWYPTTATAERVTADCASATSICDRPSIATSWRTIPMRVKTRVPVAVGATIV